MAWYPGRGQGHLYWRFRWLWTVGLLLIVPLSDTRTIDIQAKYDQARHLLMQGDVELCQKEADQEYESLNDVAPRWGSRFKLLEAEAMLQRGLYQDTLRLTDTYQPAADEGDDLVRKLAVESVALMREQKVSLADQRLAQAASLCTVHTYSSCGEMLQAHALLAAQRGDAGDAKKFFLQTLAFAQVHHDDFLRASATLNLGWIALQPGRFDEALEWSKAARQISTAIGADGLAEKSSGNMGWAYFNLGDDERALGLFLDAAKSALHRGDDMRQLKWLSTAGYVYRDLGDLGYATTLMQKALALAQHIDSKEDIVDSLDDLATLSVDTGKYQDAEQYIGKSMPLVRATGDRLDELDLMLAQARIAAARHDDGEADSALRIVENDPNSQTSMRISAEHERAKLYARQGKRVEADRMYKVALTSFEAARAQLKSEESELPFFNNAKTLYDDYVSFLMAGGMTEQALQVADWSRARTLAEGLGIAAHTNSFQPARVDPAQLARRLKSTLLFYWLGQQRSYLWAVTPVKTMVFTLPPEQTITAMVKRYQNEILEPGNGDFAVSQDGVALYRMLVAPTQALLSSSSQYVIVNDRALSQLNFETLIVPEPQPHYWIEDATLVSAPSLHMLGAAPTTGGNTGTMLLMGNPNPPDADYPHLPMAAVEMEDVAKHFEPHILKTFARESANPETYMRSVGQDYSYIHFVAHGVASRLDPLDSAIILSASETEGRPFKLYARDIIRHPIHARLVTLSACTSGGSRSYTGEGLVGLSWAFLRAGAHNVIGALWEVSDASTPRLMDGLYSGIEHGLSPSAALREAKLNLLHSHGSVSRPFFWGPFQLYGGM